MSIQGNKYYLLGIVLLKWKHKQSLTVVRLSKTNWCYEVYFSVPEKLPPLCNNLNKTSNNQQTSFSCLDPMGLKGKQIYTIYK